MFISNCDKKLLGIYCPTLTKLPKKTLKAYGIELRPSSRASKSYFINLFVYCKHTCLPCATAGASGCVSDYKILRLSLLSYNIDSIGVRIECKSHSFVCIVALISALSNSRTTLSLYFIPGGRFRSRLTYSIRLIIALMVNAMALKYLRVPFLI